VSGPPAIEVRAVRRYGPVVALAGVDMAIDAPATGLLGRNGAGKSTLMKAILGLVRLDEGAVRVLGRDAARDGDAIRRRIGYAPEHECLPPELTAADLVRHLAELRGLSRADAIRRASEVLFAVGLEEERSRVIGSFSLGMRQRVKLAQALVHAPELVILDEPTNGLDPQGIIDIRNLILRLRDDEGKTVMLSSHQLSEVELIASRMVIINKGTTVVEGSVRDLLRADDINASFEVDDVSRTCALLSEHARDVAIVKHDTHHVHVSLDKNRVPDVTLMLLTNGIRVTSVDAKRKLEEYFISLLQS